jgi:two-component system, chemotaxis family, chemotaxis protein CheY
MPLGKTVLLVDDDGCCRKSLSSMVSEFTVGEIREACNGKDGFEQYIENNPDVVFLDINMPEMDGFETLKKIREANKNANVVIVSSQATKADVFKALKLGARHYIRKDLPRECLRPMIKQLMVS